MNGKIVIDRAGRIVIPKSAREAVGLHPGDALDLIVDEDSLTLRPAAVEAPLQKERGVWVLCTGTRLTQEESNSALTRLRTRPARPR